MATKALSPMERAVLIETFALENEYADGPTHSNIMSSLLTVDSAVTNRAISFALAKLEAHQLIVKYRTDEEFGPVLHFRATTTGSDWILTETTDENTDIEYFANTIHTKLEIPASDRIVSLDHNSAAYKDATEKLDRVIEAVEADRSNDFEGKEQRLTELKAGRELFKSHQVNSKAVFAVLGSCLTYLAVKFTDVAISDLATTTWTAIMNLLGN